MPSRYIGDQNQLAELFFSDPLIGAAIQERGERRPCVWVGLGGKAFQEQGIYQAELGRLPCKGSEGCSRQGQLRGQSDLCGLTK